MPKLERQAIGRSSTTGALVVAQFWSGLPHRRHAVIFFRDGVRTAERSGAYTPIFDSYTKVAESLTARPLTEDQARDALAATGHPRETPCTACAARLPLGGRFCTTCGQPHTAQPVLTPAG